MTRRRIILLLAVALLASLGVWYWQKMPQATDDAVSERATLPTPRDGELGPMSPGEHQAQQNEKRKEIIGQIVASLNTPIEFYGKVVDQNGDPVPHARVGYGLADRFNASGSDGHTYADEAGNIHITGVKGAEIGVSASKEGYYKIHNVSNQRFAYGRGPDSTTKPPPRKDNPAIFVLHKMGKAEPLVRAEQSARIPKDGTPVTVDLATGRVSPNGNLRVEAWTAPPEGTRRFTWRCRLTVPGGGLVERKGQFDFEAPQDGYEESVELGMRQDAEQWTSDQQRDYFVKLPDGRFARINFRMIAGGNHYFVMESFLNPKPGSRNLEYDPKQSAPTP